MSSYLVISKFIYFKTLKIKLTQNVNIMSTYSFLTIKFIVNIMRVRKMIETAYDKVPLIQCNSPTCDPSPYAIARPSKIFPLNKIFLN